MYMCMHVYIYIYMHIYIYIIIQRSRPLPPPFARRFHGFVCFCLTLYIGVLSISMIITISNICCPCLCRDLRRAMRLRCSFACSDSMRGDTSLQGLLCLREKHTMALLLGSLIPSCQMT